MNKFKKADEYFLTHQPKPAVVAEKIPPVESGKAPEWECIGCADKATLLHRGTAYCRRCYDKRNYDGSLIG